MPNENTADGLLIYPNRNAQYAFLRQASNSYAAGPDDVHVPAELLKQYPDIRPADRIAGIFKEKSGQYHRSLVEITTINGKEAGKLRDRPYFDDLIPTYPDRQIKLEYAEKRGISGRIIDIVAPQGFGQRSLIVAPPRVGKTVLLQDIAISIQKNHPNVILVVLLIDERPEEVTDMREVVKGEVVASTFDEDPERHVEVAEVVIQRARRLAEMRADVVVLLDSITRLARAYNTITPTSSRILSGGLDARALPAPKRIFGAARNLKGGGSITIIGTALVDTGSKMDDVIFEEFKGTGNSEIHLDRRLMDKRVFPCVDIFKSGTRREDLFFDAATQKGIWEARKVLSRTGPVEAMEVLLESVKAKKDNQEYLRTITAAASGLKR